MLEKIRLELREIGKTFLWALLIAVFFRSLLFEPFHIPSGSMKPGLLPGDYILVSKFSYGYSKYSLPFAAIPFEGRIMASAPERGDVVVFRLPTNPKINYIKRLVGLPGDVLQMQNGVLYINNVATQKIPTDSYFDENTGQTIPSHNETFDNSVMFRTLDETKLGNKDNTAQYIVPDNHYFFMGDNRDNSQDSRYIQEVGFVHKDLIVGKAQIIFMSTNDSLLKLWKLPFSIRYNRLLKLIR
jgi:signal peptidase I